MASSASVDKDNIANALKEKIKKGHEKITNRGNGAKGGGNKSQHTFISDAIQICCLPSSPADEATLVVTNQVIGQGSSSSSSSSADTLAQSADNARCKGEKKKGGRCSRRAKSGEYCETHKSVRVEIERKEEGGIWMYKVQNDLYDVEEIKRR